MTQAADHREPTEAEVDAVVHALETITPYISTVNGTINASGWRIIYDALAGLSDYELWLGLCSLEEVMFDPEQTMTVVQLTLYELFRIAYVEGMPTL